MDIFITVQFLLCTMTAALLKSSCGFGFGIFVMMFFPFLLSDYPLAVTVSGMLSVITSSTALMNNFKNIMWKKLLVPLIVYLPVSTFAIFFMVELSSSLMKRLLGAVLIILCIYFLCFNKKLKIKATAKSGIIVGTLSGILGGMFGMSGPPIALYLLASTDDKNQYSGSIHTFFIISNLYMFLIRAYNGFATVLAFRYFLIGCAAAIFGSICGRMIFKRINAELLRKTVYFVMGFSGLIALIKG